MEVVHISKRLHSSHSIRMATMKACRWSAITTAATITTKTTMPALRR